MIFKRIKKAGQNAIKRGFSLYGLGKDIVAEGMRVYNERNENNKVVRDEEESNETEEVLHSVDEVPTPDSPIEQARQTSLNSYDVKGKNAGQNFNSNMWQRNYENHQGN